MSVHLDEARAIGDRLAASAIRARDRCTWLVREVVVDPAQREKHPTLHAVDGSIYSGTAGVALFLARLHLFTDERAHRGTALAAMRHALARAREHDAQSMGRGARVQRFGVYGGAMGVAWGALEVARLLDEPSLLKPARALVDALPRTLREPHEHDVTSGSASAIAALLSMDREADAVRVGEDLLRAAERGHGGLSWPSVAAGKSVPRNLTGFSHGASGVGWALATLFARTGEARWREAALEAFAYERACFDAEAQNWPRFDLPQRPDGRWSSTTAWCHGAPGIGLARALCAPLLKEPSLLEEARVAARTTRRHLAGQMERPGTDLSPCHGALGNAEALGLVEEALGLDPWPDLRRAAEYARQRFGLPARARADAEVEYPTPAPAGLNPALLTGTTGIGHFFLRVHAPARVPSVLVPAAGAVR